MMSGAKWYIAASFEPKSPVETITPLAALIFRNFPFVEEPGYYVPGVLNLHVCATTTPAAAPTAPIAEIFRKSLYDTNFIITL